MKHSSQLDSQRMDKTKFSISSLEGGSDDREYWLCQSAEMRIQQIEILRIVNYGNNASSRLQRFFEIAELE